MTGNNSIKILVGCEFSGIVRDSFIAAGHKAVSCDLLPSERPGPHITGNVLEILDEGWELAIFHPPCTYLCNSGVRWLAGDTNRQHEMESAAAFFRGLLDADIPHIAVENPIPHKYALAAIGRKYDQIVQPWWFGDGETKATCLWTKNLPPLEATNIVSGRTPRVHHESPGPERWKARSRTPAGFAHAMAAQWSVAAELERRKEGKI